MIKTEVLIRNFGRVEWAERKIGPGGTRFFHKVIGLIIIFISFIYMTGMLEGFIIGIVGGLFGIQ